MLDLFDNELWGDTEPDYEQDAGEIDRDSLLDWHLRWVGRLQTEREGVVARYGEAIAQLKARQEEQLISIDRKIEWHEKTLESYMRQLNAADPKLSSKAMPSGRVALRKAQPLFKVTDEDALLAWAEAVAPETVKVERTIRKNELKKVANYRNGEANEAVVALTEEGEVIPGLVVVHRHKTFSVSPLRAGGGEE